MGFVAIQNSIRIRHQQHNVIAMNMHAARQRQAHMLILRANLQLMHLSVGLLSAFGVASNAQHLMLSVQGEHIRSRRRHEAQAIIEAIPRALAQMKFCGRQNASKETHMAVGEHSLGSYLLIGIKFVTAERARSNQDEAWVTTAYYIRNTELRRLLRNGQLQPLHKKLP